MCSQGYVGAMDAFWGFNSLYAASNWSSQRLLVVNGVKTVEQCFWGLELVNKGSWQQNHGEKGKKGKKGGFLVFNQQWLILGAELMFE